MYISYIEEVECSATLFDLLMVHCAQEKNCTVDKTCDCKCAKTYFSSVVVLIVFSS